MIFFAGEERTINAYDMDRKKVHVIPALVIWYGRCRVIIEDMSRPYYLDVSLCDDMFKWTNVS
jgi:hypothetical protein